MTESQDPQQSDHVQDAATASSCSVSSCGGGIDSEASETHLSQDGRSFVVTGMDCAEEVEALRREVGPVAPVCACAAVRSRNLGREFHGDIPHVRPIGNTASKNITEEPLTP